MTEKQMLENMYWEQGLNITEIADVLGWPYHKAYKRFRLEYDIPTHKIIWQGLEIEDQELRERLNTKWSQIRARIEGSPGHDLYGHYGGKPICTEQEFVDFCNQHKDELLAMWHTYLQSGKELRLAPSVDRIDPDGGYTIDNLQFVIYGYNSWKDHLNPVRVTMNGETRCFGSPTEAGRYWNVRTDDIVEVLRDSEYNRHNVKIEAITMQELLDAHSCKSLRDYYHHHLV